MDTKLPSEGSNPLEEAAKLLDDESYDPFEAFDSATGSGRMRNPYPLFAEIRQRSGVYLEPLWDLMGIVDVAERAVAGEGPFATAMSYEACSYILRHADIFSSSGYGKVMGIVMGHTILEMDDPEHKRYRGLIEQAFTRKAMERWERTIIRPIVDRCIDEFAERGSADLVRELTFPFPVNVITALLGLPEEDTGKFHRWAVALINVGSDPMRGFAASQRLYGYLNEIIDRKREEPPAEDVISALVYAELDGQRLSNDEIIAFLRLLLPAGGETTYRSSGNLLFGLLTNPEQLDALRDDRSLLPQAIEEGLRWEAPLTGISRWATSDVELEGVPLAAGTHVTVCVGSANHDEKRWEEPERFDIMRKPQGHLAFAAGPHVCLGMHLARFETAIAINAVLDRLPDLRPDKAAWEERDVHVTGLGFRSPTALPVLFG